MEELKLKKIVGLFLTIFLCISLASCTNIPADESGGNVEEFGNNTNNMNSDNIKKDIEWISQPRLRHEIEKRFGKLAYEYTMSGGDFYFSDNGFAFVFPFSEPETCTTYGIQLKLIYPDLAKYADENGYISRKAVEEYFNSSVEISEDMNEGVFFLTVAEEQEVFDCDENGTIHAEQHIWFSYNKQTQYEEKNIENKISVEEAQNLVLDYCRNDGYECQSFQCFGEDENFYYIRAFLTENYSFLLGEYQVDRTTCEIKQIG